MTTMKNIKQTYLFTPSDRSFLVMPLVSFQPPAYTHSCVFSELRECTCSSTSTAFWLVS